MTSQNFDPLCDSDKTQTNKPLSVRAMYGKMELAGTLEAYLAIVSRYYGQMGSEFERKP